SDTDHVDGTGNDVPEVVLSGALTAAAELNVAVAQAGVGGGLFLDVFFNLYDPPDPVTGKPDGKVRFKELIDNARQSPLGIFDVSGKFTAGLFAYIKIGFNSPFGFVTLFQANVDLATVTLLDFTFRHTPTPPTLGTYDASPRTLTLATTDGDDTIQVLPGPDVGSVIVDARGAQQRFDNVARILADGGAGNDVITVGDTV